MNIEYEVQKRITEVERFRDKLSIVQTIEECDFTVKRACEILGVPRSSYYDWKKKYDLEGEKVLKRKKPIALIIQIKFLWKLLIK